MIFIIHSEDDFLTDCRNVNLTANNCRYQDYINPDNQLQPTTNIDSRGLRPFTVITGILSIATVSAGVSVYEQMSVSLFLRTIQAKCDRKRVLGSVIESTCSIYECVGVCKRLDVFMCASMKHAYVYVRKKSPRFCVGARSTCLYTCTSA